MTGSLSSRAPICPTVAVVCDTTLHRDVIGYLLRNSSSVRVGPSVASVEELDQLDDGHGEIDFAVIALPDDSGLALLTASVERSWADQLLRADPMVVIGWDATPQDLARLFLMPTSITELLARAGSSGRCGNPNGNGNGAGSSPGERALGRLTDRELSVLDLIAEGRTATEAARVLGISRHTVRTHVANLLRKLGVHSRLEAVALTRDALTDELARRTNGVR